MKKQHYVLFRILTSLIFLYAGFGHVVHPAKIVGKFSKAYFYTVMPGGSFTTILIIISGIVMLIAGLMLAAGFYEKASCYYPAGCINFDYPFCSVRQSK